MYIWILLATIMVALSFFNVAPRADKEHALNEIKAATVVNRFKAEHVAMLRNIECEIILRRNDQYWDGNSEVNASSASRAVEVTDFTSFTAGGLKAYTNFTDHLPIGYMQGNNRKDGSGQNYSLRGKMRHFVYCLDKPAESTITDASSGQYAGNFISCRTTEEGNGVGYNRYLVSVMPIRDRWVTKDGSKKPLPILTNILAKTPSRTAKFGWSECSESGCVLHGVGSHAVRLEYTGHDDFGNVKQEMHHVILSSQSKIWDNPVFKYSGNVNDPTSCYYNTCLFAYEQIPVADTACHCENLIRAANGQPRLTMDECYPVAREENTPNP